MKLIRNILFPELALFEDREDRKRALRTLGRNPWYWIGVVGIVCGCSVLTLSLPSLGVPMEYRWYARGGLMLLQVAVPLAIILLLRRSVRRNLRMALAKRGVPICIPCGYNLTGNTSGVCPECGTQVKDQS